MNFAHASSFNVRISMTRAKESERASERARARRKESKCQLVNQSAFHSHLSLTVQNTSTQDTVDS